MKRNIFKFACLLTPFVFNVSVVKAYSPPNLANVAYTGNPFAISPNYLVGQCTWYCYGRIQEVGLMTSSQLASLPNRNGGTGIFLSNASTWIADAVAAGISTGSTPQVGALAVWTGQNHVAFVESVSGSTITVTECNNTPKAGANIVVGGSYARLRSTMDASSSGNILWTMPQFTVMNALSGPSSVVNGYQWVQLTGNGYTGYVAWLDLVPSQPATPTGLQWNITQFQNSPGSQWITSASPTYIYLGSQPTVAITFATSPAGLQVTVDGTTYTTPATFNWVPSSQHTLSVPTPQYFGLYSRYVFNGTQNQTITTPSSSYTYTANLSIQYDLTMAAGTGGSCSPSGGWYDSGSVVAIGATPNGGYSFSSWTGSGTGSYTGTANSTSVTMNAPIFETANFTANPQTGSLQVTISPAGAVSAGAQWQMDGARGRAAGPPFPVWRWEAVTRWRLTPSADGLRPAAKRQPLLPTKPRRQREPMWPFRRRVHYK